MNSKHQFINPKRIVTDGYDTISDIYTKWAGRVRKAEREKYTKILLERLPPKATILELGCGAGVPTTKLLAKRFTVTGVDISGQQIARAKKNIPNATFFSKDMTKLKFPENSFDSVTAFYSITHVPREEQKQLLENILKWLKPGGLFVASMGASDTSDIDNDWLGVPMYFSHFNSETNKKLVVDVGFNIISAVKESDDEEMGTPISFLWIVAEK